MDDERARRGAWPSPGEPRRRTRPRAARSDAVRFALWFNAWAAGAVSLDEARDGIVADDAAHDVVGLPDRTEPVPLILALGALRAERAGSAGLALPVPGDLVGLGGPAEFNAEALEAGEAVVLDGADLGLVPARAGAGVVWRCMTATSRRQVPSLPEADTDLRATLPRVADALADLEVARWRPEVADELMALHSGDPVLLPPGADARVARMVDLADRCRHVVELALQDDGGARTAGEASSRREPLVRLDAASPACAGRRLLAPVAGRGGTDVMLDADEAPKTLLLTLTGTDRPGVTAGMFATLATYGVEVLDVEQIVLRGRLVLGVLVTAPRSWKTLRDAIEKLGVDLEMTVEVDRGHGDNLPRRGGRGHVTVLGTPLTAKAMAAVTGRIADLGANIDRIERMARYPVTAIDLHVSGADPDRLRLLLAEEAARQQVDIAVQPANLLRHGMRLIVMDVDSTLVQGEVIEMLAERAGCLAEVEKVTEAAMRGDLDFEASLRQRVALLEGLDASALDDVFDALVLTPGARTLVRTLKRLGYRFAIVSGGFTHVTDKLAERLRIDFSAANELEVADGRLTGRIVGPVVDRAGKAEALRRFAAQAGVSEAATVAVGDGANDLDMLAAAGLGIAFNAKPVVQEAADTTVNVPFLDAIIYLLGISREEVEAADAEAGFVTPAPPV